MFKKIDRRRFVFGLASAASLASLPQAVRAAMGPNDKFDLLIQGGEVLDPSQRLRGVRDIGIRNGGAHVGKRDREPLKRAIRACELSGMAGAKVMCHIGGVETPQLMSQILDMLRAKDILSPRRSMRSGAACFSTWATAADRSTTSSPKWRSRPAPRRTRSPPTSTSSPATRRACPISLG